MFPPLLQRQSRGQVLCVSLAVICDYGAGSSWLPIIYDLGVQSYVNRQMQRASCQISNRLPSLIRYRSFPSCPGNLFMERSQKQDWSTRQTSPRFADAAHREATHFRLLPSFQLFARAFLHPSTAQLHDINPPEKHTERRRAGIDGQRCWEAALGQSHINGRNISYCTYQRDSHLQVWAVLHSWYEKITPRKRFFFPTADCESLGFDWCKEKVALITSC